MRMLKWILAGMLMMVVVVASGWAAAPAEDADAALLETLRKNGTITQEQYDVLKKKYEKGTADEQASTKPVPLQPVWDKGLHFISPGKAFDVQVGGRVLYDWAAIDAGDEAEDAFAGGDTLEGTGTKLRQARLAATGTMYEQFPFSAEFEFLKDKASVVEVWVGIADIPVLGEVRVGHQKEAFSLENMDSLKYTVFIERGLPKALVPERNPGIKINNDIGEQLAWGVGFYKNTAGSDAFTDHSDYNVSARVTSLPYANDDLSQLVHVGLSYQHRFMSGGETIQYRSRPEVSVTDAYTVDTDEIAGADNVDTFGPELAFVFGPFSMQGEYVQAFLDDSEANNPRFSGYYVFGSWFLTGEHRVYKIGEAGGEFSRVKPKRYFSPADGGWGAWETGIRYSNLDLRDEGIQGGVENNWTAGLNWYLNPNLRWSLDYIRASIKDRNSDGIAIDDSDADIVVTRFQVDF